MEIPDRDHEPTTDTTSDDETAERKPLEPGEHIGRYCIECLLGRGGFGEVYRAHDEQLDRTVAVKVPHPKIQSRPDSLKKVLDEARASAMLDHPNIVPIFDLGSTDDFPCFIVSRYVSGITLHEFRKLRAPTPDMVANLIATLADALQHAHQQGIVHRDIKPDNVLVDATGNPWLLDFGLALEFKDFGVPSLQAGTPVFMSPEQASGGGHRVDGRTDIYSLGVAMYYTLTGQVPFSAVTVDELLDQVINLEPRPPRQWNDAIPPELERICLRTLAKSPSDRYSTARDLADELRAAVNEESSDHAWWYELLWIAAIAIPLTCIFYFGIRAWQGNSQGTPAPAAEEESLRPDRPGPQFPPRR